MDNTLELISQIYNSMSKFIVDRLSDKGIKNLVISHGTIILVLREVDHLPMQDLAAKINKSPQTVTTLVRKLESEGYVRIEKSKLDKRIKVVSLTDNGKDFVPIIFDISKDLFDIQYQGFTKEEQKMLRTLLKKMIHNLE